jgi:hypothetical protein
MMFVMGATVLAIAPRGWWDKAEADAFAMFRPLTR